MSDTQSNPPRKGIRKGIYIVPSAFTILNIMCGFYAIVNAIQAVQLGLAPKALELFDHAAIAVGLAVIFDGLDGRIARMTKTTSEFGVELDSIADVVTFGVAPAVLAYTWGYGGVQGIDRYGWGVSFFFMICGALRLARFNVMARSPKFDKPGTSPKLDKKSFVGLPIPPSAAVLASVIHFAPMPLIGYEGTTRYTFGWALLIGMTLLGMLMVSTIRYTSFKNLGAKSMNPFITLPLLAALLSAIYFHSQVVLLTLSVSYAAHGLVLKGFSLLGRFRRQQPATKDLNDPSTIEL
ncbi:MAG: CDP-diacylglycerol--serine O-phosphatidyltransferase [Acidobacteria bacterium]|nr:CDP-diacylglycerol--serine O-phosphatidyltransferase [Acidobacteriota bacterium]